MGMCRDMWSSSVTFSSVIESHADSCFACCCCPLKLHFLHHCSLSLKGWEQFLLVLDYITKSWRFSGIFRFQLETNVGYIYQANCLHMYEWPFCILVCLNSPNVFDSNVLIVIVMYKKSSLLHSFPWQGGEDWIRNGRLLALLYWWEEMAVTLLLLYFFQKHYYWPLKYACEGMSRGIHSRLKDLIRVMKMCTLGTWHEFTKRRWFSIRLMIWEFLVNDKIIFV